MLEMLQNWGLGFANVLEPMNLLLLIAGTMLGLIVGALPGLNSSIAMSILIPVTYTMNPAAALGMLAGIYTGSTCGGSVSAILLEVPAIERGYDCRAGARNLQQDRGYASAAG